jgi:CRISPR-associated endonuclease Cas1
MGVAALFINPDGKLTSTLVPGGLEGSRVGLHRIQATAKDTDVGVKIARMLISRKLRGQFNTLNWLADHGLPILADRDTQRQRVRTATSRLQRVCTWVDNVPDIEGAVLAERDGAGIYWSALSGIPLKWTPNAGRKVPEHWLCTQPRESYRTGNRFGATDPANALLNYGYALLEAETRIACLNSGLHPGIGIFHADHDARASFVYDLMEPIRPVVDRLAFEFFLRHEFRKGDCWETREGHCRLDPLLASQVAHWSAQVRPQAAAVVREVVNQLAALSARRA